jgi:hypothetical protein
MILGRTRAYEGTDRAVLAEVFDDAEYLAGLLCVDEDCTDQFREYLQGVAEKYGWQRLTDTFDAVAPTR